MYKAKSLTQNAKNYNILSAGINPDEDLRKEACQMLRAQKIDIRDIAESKSVAKIDTRVTEQTGKAPD